MVFEVLSSDSLPAGFDHSISSLAEAAHHPDWVAWESIDISIHQHLLSKHIDDVFLSDLLSSAQDSRAHVWLFHPLSLTLGTSSLSCLLPLSNYTYRTESFIPAYNIGWGFQPTQRMVTAQFVFIRQTVVGIIRWAAVGPTRGLLVMVTSATLSSLLLNQPLWPPEGRCLP